MSITDSSFVGMGWADSRNAAPGARMPSSASALKELVEFAPFPPMILPQTALDLPSRNVDHFLGMNDELAQLKKRIADLERQNQELRREITVLKGQPQKEIPRTSGDKGRDILQYLFDNPQNLTATQVATRIKLTLSVVQYHLDRLVLLGQLTTAQNLTEVESTGNRVGYVITPQGRAAITGAA